MVRRRGSARSVLRFLGAVLATSGALLVLDAGLTLAWQEPVSALLVQRQQSQLEDELERRTSVVARDLGRLSSPPSQRQLIRRLARRERGRLKRGRAVGALSMPTLDRRYAMVHGTDTATLRKGPAHFPDTPLPGEGGTVAIAGHRTTYGAPFRPLDRLQPGDPLVLTMPYGRFTYRVERTRIVPPDALWVTRRVSYERAVLVACHPLYSAAKRIVVFARLARVDPTTTPAR